MDIDNTDKMELLKQVNAQASTIAALQAENTRLGKELANTENSRSEWMGRAQKAYAQLEELRLAFKVLVRGGKED